MSTSGHAGHAAIESAVAAGASKSTYVGSGMAVGGWLLSSEVAALMGIILGVLGLLINLAFRWRADRREQREHEARMRTLEAGR